MRRVLKILLACTAFFTLAGQLLLPVYAVFVKDIGGDLLTAGTSYAVFLLACGLLLIALSHWENTHKKYVKHFVVLSYALKAAGFISYVFVSQPWHLYAVQAVLGISEAINAPAYDGLYSKNLTKGKFILQWGYWDATWYIAAAVGAALGGFIAQTYGFNTLFLTMASVAVLGLLTALLLFWGDRGRKK